MEKLFEFEQIYDPMRVIFACTKDKTHASLWWDKLQLEWESKGKDQIKT
jgi:hypothetical protein